MTAENQDFRIYEGDTKKVKVALSDDLTGATIKWGFADTLKETGNGISITPDGFEITLIPEDTLGKAAFHQHEAEVTDAQGNVSTVMTGKLYIMSGVL